jgi:hypothetical protein
MTDKQQAPNDCVESAFATDQNRSLHDISLQYDELNYGELEQSANMPPFEFSSPISSISSNCSSPDRTAVQHDYMMHADDDELMDDDSDEFISLEELKSQISPPSDDECSTTTLTRKSMLETIFEDIYLETPPGSPSTPTAVPKRRRRVVRTNLSDEFKENVQKN